MEKVVVRHYVNRGGQLPVKPVIIENFDTDTDVLIIDEPELSRKDLIFEQESSDTWIRLADSFMILAELKNVNAIDLDPVPFLKRFYKALQENELDELLSFLADKVVWEMGGPQDIMPWAGKCEGRAGVTRFFELRKEGIAFEKLIPSRFVAQGNTVAVVLEGSGETKSGVPFSGGAVHWVTVRNGKIAHLQCYRDTFPIIEALHGGRPFTVSANAAGSQHYVNEPLATVRTADSIVFDEAVLDKVAATVKSARAMYAALQGLKAEEVRKAFASNVVWHMFGPPDIIAWSGERIGPIAAVESAKQIIETMHFEHFKAVRMIYQDNVAAVLIDEPGVSKATGLSFHTSVVHIVVVNEDGKVASIHNYVNTASIAEAFSGGRPYTVN
ncbi:nuclear transport factor 2 family protein [Dyadobacter sp. CY107]|uniref:nuclear transport factor 2 family protein n=1 Tax=Dyadobacter fanqingshengii TaxID=2906443 RepID=UPI001F1D5FA2|nr:nuclear transport factor 2 family protein [Dyadobacter fanqingshengii]MCF2501802.1 nuclear transport factor 2 family protein [Dyadobacter fanqingshengii]